MSAYKGLVVSPKLGIRIHIDFPPLICLDSSTSACGNWGWKDGIRFWEVGTGRDMTQALGEREGYGPRLWGEGGIWLWELGDREPSCLWTWGEGGLRLWELKGERRTLRVEIQSCLILWVIQISFHFTASVKTTALLCRGGNLSTDSHRG